MRRDSRRSGAVVLSLGLLALAAAGCGEAEPDPTPRPPSLILVSIDTLRADHVGAYGYPLPTTPHIDRLATDAVRFSTCVAQAPITLASHASILTSLLPRHHGASVSAGSRLGEGLPSLAEVLSARGYATASFNGGIQLDAAYGLDRGFDLYRSSRSLSAASRSLTGPEDRLSHVVEEGLDWLSGVEPPFFLFLHSYEIHHPYTPDPEHLQALDAGYAGALPSHISVDLLRRINDGSVPVDDADVAHIVHAYDAELRSADAAVGELVAQLRERDLYDDTLIVLTSDHGEEFGEHGTVGWHAHTLFDELLLVPLLFKLPESRLAGSVRDAPARGIDVAPTALAVLGVDAPPGFAGRDLLSDGVPEAPIAALSMHDTAPPLLIWTLRAGPWKLKRVEGGREVLFDLASDPLELRDVSELHAQRVADLRRRGLEALRERQPPPRVPARVPEETEARLRALGYVE